MNKPKCVLIGADGNVFNLAALVMNTLRKAGMKEQAKEVAATLFKCGSMKML